MSDHIMCNNQECMNADYCRRQTDERKNRQHFKHFLNQGDKCDHFIPNDKYKVFAVLAGKDFVDYSTINMGQYMDRELRRSVKTKKI